MEEGRLLQLFVACQRNAGVVRAGSLCPVWILWACQAKFTRETVYCQLTLQRTARTRLVCVVASKIHQCQFAFKLRPVTWLQGVTMMCYDKFLGRDCAVPRAAGTSLSIFERTLEERLGTSLAYVLLTATPTSKHLIPCKEIIMYMRIMTTFRARGPKLAPKNLRQITL